MSCVCSGSACLLALCCCVMAVRASLFDVRTHLSTKTRYLYRTPIPGAPSVHDSPDPAGYEPAHLYLLSRHGSRWPTKARMNQINVLDRVFKDATNTEGRPWIKNWSSPLTKMDMAGGELHQIGADEMWSLAYRLRQRFPGLVAQPYLPKKFPVISTVVARAAASANAFTSGYFPTVRSTPPVAAVEGADGATAVKADAAAHSYRRQLLGGRRLNSDEQHYGPYGRPLGSNTSRPQAVAIMMAPKNSDPLLRFFDTCPAYEELDKHTEAWLGPWMARTWSSLAPKLEERLGMARPLGPCDVQGLWQLCLLEAGILDVCDQACSLFEPEEVLLLEWLDDVRLLETQSHGAALNYEIARPLLFDMVHTLERAVTHHKEHAKLLFAHCETLVPLASLMGLFRPEGMEERLPRADFAPARAGKAATKNDKRPHELRHLSGTPHGSVTLPSATDGDALKGGGVASCVLDLPEPYQSADQGPDPPPGWQPHITQDKNRMWRGSRIAPYGANMALVLYHKIGTDRSLSNHCVRLVYNEQVVPVPGCSTDSGLDCTLEEFLHVMKPLAGDGKLDRLCTPQSMLLDLSNVASAS